MYDVTIYIYTHIYSICGLSTVGLMGHEAVAMPRMLIQMGYKPSYIPLRPPFI